MDYKIKGQRKLWSHEGSDTIIHFPSIFSNCSKDLHTHLEQGHEKNPGTEINGKA